MSQRFFSAASDAVYEQTRATLDAAWGLPNSLGTQTCFCPVGQAPRDVGGRPLVAVHAEWCGWPPADTMLPQLLASGAVQELTQSAYQSVTHPAD